MKYGFYLSITLLLFACGEKKVLPEQEASNFCTINWELISSLDEELPIVKIDCTCPLGCEDNWVDEHYHKDPTFNPVNPRELIYIRGRTNERSCNREIRILDLCTGEDRFVVQGACYSLSWSVKNWILFTGEDRQVWKVKSDGDSLQRITSGGLFNNYPVWNPTGDKFAFLRISSSTHYVCIADKTGNILDTLDQLFHTRAFKWPKEDLIIGMTGVDTVGPFHYSISQDKLELIDGVDISLSSDSLIDNVEYLASENAIIWQSFSGITKTNIDTKKREYLAVGGSFAKTKRYLGLALSPDENYIIYPRQDLEQEITCLYDIRQRLYSIDLKNLVERKLLLPD